MIDEWKRLDNDAKGRHAMDSDAWAILVQHVHQPHCSCTALSNMHVFCSVASCALNTSSSCMLAFVRMHGRCRVRHLHSLDLSISFPLLSWYIPLSHACARPRHSGVPSLVKRACESRFMWTGVELIFLHSRSL
jgi:hypothetical protein